MKVFKFNEYFDSLNEAANSETVEVKDEITANEDFSVNAGSGGMGDVISAQPSANVGSTLSADATKGSGDIGVSLMAGVNPKVKNANKKPKKSKTKIYNQITPSKILKFNEL